jgi:hypothetical protein
VAIIKRVLCKERLRQVPPQFSWVDHRLVRDRHISRCSANALALYLFLVTVADGEGLSYYADQTISRLLPLDAAALGGARRELIDNRLVAYQRPLYQVLALGPAQPSSRPQSSGRPSAGSTSSPQASSGPRRPPPSWPQPHGGPGDTQPAGPESLAQIFRKLMELPDDRPGQAPAQDKPSAQNRRKP